MNTLLKFLFIATIAFVVFNDVAEAKKRKRVKIIELLIKGCGCDSSSSSSDSCELPDTTTTPKPDICGPNEVWDDCPPACYGDGCFAFVYVQRCNQTCAPEPGCVCKCGYFRNSAGLCVPKSECGKQFTNTQYEDFCRLDCGPDRIVRDNTNSCLQFCPGAPVRCSNEQILGCYCKPGYCLDWNTSECVPGVPHTGADWI